MPQSHVESCVRIRINGQDKDVPAQNLASLLRLLGMEGEALVAELNGSIIPPENFAATPLAHGDALELVRFVGGG